MLKKYKQERPEHKFGELSGEEWGQARQHTCLHEYTTTDWNCMRTCQKCWLTVPAHRAPPFGLLNYW